MILNFYFRFCWYLVMRKIVRRNPLLAFKCFILLFMISSPNNIFHVQNILSTSNNISHSNCYVSLTLWGDWVCESLVPPQMAFLVFRLIPNHPPGHWKDSKTFTTDFPVLVFQSLPNCHKKSSIFTPDWLLDWMNCVCGSLSPLPLLKWGTVSGVALLLHNLTLRLTSVNSWQSTSSLGQLSANS